MGGDEALRLVAHWVAVELALGLRRDRGAVRQGEAVQGRLSVTLQEGCTQTRGNDKSTRPDARRRSASGQNERSLSELQRHFTARCLH